MKNFSHLSMEETNGFVSIVNTLIEKSGYSVDEQGIGYDIEGNITSLNGDSLTDTLDWVLNDLLK